MFHRLGSAILLVLLTLIFITSNVKGQSGYRSEEELIRAAEKYFNEKNYEKAFPLFSQVVSNRPDNSHYNYCLGVCIMEVAPDKAEAVRFLEIATKSPQNPNDSWLYLGKAYHSSYKYDEAIAAFESYKLNSGRSAWNNANGDALIQMCKNGIDVKNDLSLQRHRILEKSETATIDFFLLYKNIPEVGRFLKLPKEYEDKSTKGSHESAYVFLPSSGNTLVYSNASKNNGKGFDIFKVIKDQKGLWLFPEMLSDIINSSGDEAFPVIVNDGKTLYFSSKGSRSTGGYDIFKSELDFSTSSWSEPVPMGPPVNSPGDDFYYVPSVDNKFAYFSSNRESAAGKCDVYKVSIIHETRNFIAISGLFNCKSGLELSEAKVTIMNPDDRSIVAQFRTPSQDGNYNLKLPVPSQFIYLVELAGFNSQEQLVDLSGYASTKLLQEIYLVRTDEAKEKMTITNRIPVEDNVVAGNQSSINPSITQNVGERDMALATTNNRNVAVASPRSKSDVESSEGVQTSATVDEQNSKAKSQEATPSNSSATKTNEPLAVQSNSSKSKASAPQSTDTSDPVKFKDGSSITPSPKNALEDLVTIENINTSSDEGKKSRNDNKAGEKDSPVATNSNTENVLANSNTKKEGNAASSGSIVTGTVNNATPSSIASESEKNNSNQTTATNSSATNSTKGISDDIASNKKSEGNNSITGELVTASATLVAPIENKSSDKNSITESEKQNAQPEKSSSPSSIVSKSNSEGSIESITSKNSDGSVASNSLEAPTSRNSASTPASSTSTAANTEISSDGTSTLSQGSTNKTSEENTQQVLSANSENENQNSIPTASENSSKSVNNKETTATAETKNSGTVTSTKNEKSNTATSSDLASGNEQSNAIIAENKSTTASNQNSLEEPSANNEVNATNNSIAVPTTTSETISSTTGNEKSNTKTSAEKASQPASQVTSLNIASPASTPDKPPAQQELKKADESEQQKSTSTATAISTTSETTPSSKSSQVNPKQGTSDPSISGQTQTDIKANQSTSTVSQDEINQNIASEKNQSQNSSGEIEKESGNQVASSQKSEKRSGIFGNRSKKKEKEVTPANEAIPEFTFSQPAVEEMPEPPKNLIFRVQLGAYKDRNADDLKKRYSDIGLTDLIYVKNEDGLLLVMTGSEKNYDSALTLKVNMIEKGVADAFIVAYSDGSRLPLESVVKIAE